LFYLNSKSNDYWERLLDIYPNLNTLSLYLRKLSKFNEAEHPISIDISKLTKTINAVPNQINKVRVIRQLDDGIVDKINVMGVPGDDFFKSTKSVYGFRRCKEHLFEFELDTSTSIETILSNW